MVSGVRMEREGTVPVQSRKRPKSGFVLLGRLQAVQEWPTSTGRPGCPVGGGPLEQVKGFSMGNDRESVFLERAQVDQSQYSSRYSLVSQALIPSVRCESGSSSSSAAYLPNS